MLATTIDTLNIPPLWYSVVQQIQTASAPPSLTYAHEYGHNIPYILGNSSTLTTHVSQLPRIEQLGWNALEALETHLRFRNFAEDWDAPGMEAYDDL